MEVMICQCAAGAPGGGNSRMYWCVTREFRGDGTAKADMTCRVCGEKPENKAMRIYRLDHFEDWFEDRKEAEAFLAAAWAEIGEKAA